MADNNIKPNKGDIESALRFGSAIGTPRSPVSTDLVINPVSDGLPYVVLPADYALHDLERLLPIPVRKRAAVTLIDADSYISYTAKHGSADTCTHYAAVDYERGECSVIGVINDHGASHTLPGWRDHTAQYSPILSLEWRRWHANNTIQMQQSKFAAFIEDNIQDVIVAPNTNSPSGAQMLEMAMSFEATSDKRFKRKIDLQTGGVHLEYLDKADETTSTKLRMFERFFIGIPAFQGSTSAYPLEARLKFRQNNDALHFWYELVRPDRVFRQAVTEELTAVQQKTGFPLLYGNPNLLGD